MPAREDRPGHPETRSPASAPPVPGLSYLTVLPELQTAFAELINTVDLDAPVAACGTWTTTDLILHLGAVHRWAAGMARGEARDDVEPTEPRDRGGLRAFYREQADLLIRTLHEIGPDHVAVTLNGPGPASFWHRRQVHETLVHLADLMDPAGTGLPDVEVDLWADAVDEVITMFTPRQVRLERIAPIGTPVRFVATDADRSWVLGHGGAPLVAVSGPARALALLLWQRTTVDNGVLLVSGDRAVLEDVLALPLTP